MGRRIGWTDREKVYLDPEAAYAAAQELARKQGGALPVQPRTLWKRLDEAGLLAAKDRGRNTYKASAGERRVNVIVLSAYYMAPGAGQSGHVGQATEKGSSLKAPVPMSVRGAKVRAVVCR